MLEEDGTEVKYTFRVTLKIQSYTYQTHPGKVDMSVQIRMYCTVRDQPDLDLDPTPTPHLAFITNTINRKISFYSFSCVSARKSIKKKVLEF